MKKWFTYTTLLVFLLANVSLLKGQIRFTVNPSIEGVFSVDRIFQFTIMNFNPTEKAEGFVTIRIQEAGGKLLVTHKSVPLKLKSNEAQFGTNIDWLNAVEYVQTKESNLLKDIGTLPYGNYSICYSFTGSTVKPDQYCTEVKSKPQLPPQLLSPYNASVITTLNPLLTWIPPMPDINIPYQYALKLVELKQNQTCSQALQQNIPIVQEQKYDNTNYQVNNIKGLELEIGKNYCWQVDAFAKNSKVGSTDIWQFQIGENKETSQAANEDIPYYYLKQNLDGDNIKTNRFVRFAFNNRYGINALKYSIYNEETKERLEKQVQDITLYSGVNQINLDCQTINLKTKTTYILEVTDADETKYFCRFSYQKK